MKISSTEDLGIVARQRRHELQLSQAELAARAGVTRQWLTRFEGGNSEVALSKVFAVLREIDLKIRVDVPEEVAGTAEVTYVIPRVVTSTSRLDDPGALTAMKEWIAGHRVVDADE